MSSDPELYSYVQLHYLPKVNSVTENQKSAFVALLVALVGRGKLVMVFKVLISKILILGKKMGKEANEKLHVYS